MIDKPLILHGKRGQHLWSGRQVVGASNLKKRGTKEYVLRDYGPQPPEESLLWAVGRERTQNLEEDHGFHSGWGAVDQILILEEFLSNPHMWILGWGNIDKKNES